MRSALTHPFWLPLVAAGALVCPQNGQAQALSADYALSRPGPGPAGQDAGMRFSLGSLRIGLAPQSPTGLSGAGLSLQAGRNWFARVELKPRLESELRLPGPGSHGVLSLAGGYRWGDGQSLSLHVSGGRGADRLGLSLSYDWPRYFVRLGYDPRLRLVPRDQLLRLSAGLRF